MGSSAVTNGQGKSSPDLLFPKPLVAESRPN